MQRKEFDHNNYGKSRPRAIYAAKSDSIDGTARCISTEQREA